MRRIVNTFPKLKRACSFSDCERTQIDAREISKLYERLLSWNISFSIFSILFHDLILG